MNVNVASACLSGAVESTHLLRDVRVRTKPQYLVVGRSSVSCRRLHHGAREVNACGAYVVTAVMILSCCYRSETGCRFGDELQSFRLSSNNEIFPGFYFLGGACGRREAREDHGRALRGERLKQVRACPPSVVVESEND